MWGVKRSTQICVVDDNTLICAKKSPEIALTERKAILHFEGVFSRCRFRRLISNVVRILIVLEAVSGSHDWSHRIVMKSIEISMRASISMSPCFLTPLSVMVNTRVHHLPSNLELEMHVSNKAGVRGQPQFP
jgi:hypothetical protein